MPVEHLPPPVPDLEQVDVFDPVAIMAIGLDRDLPMAAELVIAVDVERAHVQRQGLIEVVDRDAQRGGLGAIDIEIKLRRLGPELGGHAGKSVQTAQLGDHGVGLALEFLDFQAAAVLDDQLESSRDPEAGNR